MATSNSELGAKEMLSILCSGNGTVVLDTLEELDFREPTRVEAQVLKKALSIVKDPVLSFQIKKSFRLAVFKLKKANFKVSTDGFEKLLKDQNRLDDLALAIATVETAEAFLTQDIIKQINWTSFPAPILPSFCQFFKRFGNIQDSFEIQQLTRHPDPTVLTAALSSLEKLDPGNLQGIIVPLLTSPQPVVRAQAIQAFYRWNKGQATQHLLDMLFSKEENEVQLAIHHATYFPYPEIEPHLLRLISACNNPSILMRISQLIKKNAHQEIPFKLFWLARSLQGQHQSLVKGMLLGIVRELSAKKLIDCSSQEYLNRIKERAKKEELQILKDTCQFQEDADEENSLPSLEAISGQEEEHPKDEIVKEEKPKIKQGFENYSELPTKARIQMLARLDANTFKENKPLIISLFRESEGKEKASIINLIGKFGNSQEDLERVKPSLQSEDPDLVCATIKALANLDPDYLCLYLPQFMQDRNGKIRMTATRVFVTIDKETIKSLLSSLISSNNIKQRTLGISTSMLVDFSLVRESLIEALAKETSLELLDKLCVVLSANPDRELLNCAFAKVSNDHRSLKAEKFKVLESIADKLAIALDNISSPEELYQEAKDFFEQSQKELKKQTEQKNINNAENKENPSESNSKNSNSTEVDTSVDITNPDALHDVLTQSSTDSKAKRAKATVIVWLLVALAWGAAIAIGALKFLFGD